MPLKKNLSFEVDASSEWKGTMYSSLFSLNGSLNFS